MFGGGQVGSFTTESLRLRDDEDPYGRSKELVMKEAQIARLRKELEVLKVLPPPRPPPPPHLPPSSPLP